MSIVVVGNGEFGRFRSCKALLNFLMERSGYAQMLHPLITEDAIDEGSLIFHNL